jgi:hypothetical protein
MAVALKAVLGPALVRELAGEFRAAHQPFDAGAFVARCLDGLDALEFTGRAAHIADALHVHLPGPFRRAAAIVESTLGAELPATGANGLDPLRHMPHVAFVQRHGLDDYEASIRLQAALTKRFTA